MGESDRDSNNILHQNVLLRSLKQNQHVLDEFAKRKFKQGCFFHTATF